MSCCCLQCRKKTEIEYPKVIKTRNGRIMLLSNCANCGNKKLKFIKDKEGTKSLSSLGMKKKTILSKILRVNMFF